MQQLQQGATTATRPKPTKILTNYEHVALVALFHFLVAPQNPYK
jgi:hypothetical protein